MTYTLHPHALKQASLKGISTNSVLQAANHPTITYENRRFEGQRRHIRDDVVAVVDEARSLVITVYRNVVETDLRADQTDSDALKYGKRRALQTV